MKKKEVAFFMMALLMTVCLVTLSARGGKQAVEGEKPMEISWIGLLTADDLEDGNLVQRHIEERFNVKLTNKVIPYKEVERLNLMVNSGEMPDAAYIMKLDAEKLWYDGILRSIPKDMIREHAPLYSKYLDEHPPGWLINLVPDKKDEYRALTGVLAYKIGLTYVSNMRLDWLDKVGMSPTDMIDLAPEEAPGKMMFSKKPFDVEELERILIAFRDEIPGISPLTATAHRNESWTNLKGMFGIARERSLLYEGKTLWTEISPPYKDFLKLMQKWFKMELLDSELAITTYPKWKDKIAAGLAGAWCFPWTDYSMAKHLEDEIPQKILRAEPDARLVVMPPYIGPEGKSGTASNYPFAPLGHNFFVRNDVSDEKLAKILEIFDYVNVDKEGMVLANHGEAGVHFDWYGEPYNSFITIKPGVSQYGGNTGFYFYTSMFRDERDYVYSTHPSVMGLAKFFSSKEMQDLAIFPYKHDIFSETDYVAKWGEYLAALRTIQEEFFLEAVTGLIDIDAEWDGYVKKWMDAGGKEVLTELEKSPIVSEFQKGNIKY